MKKLSSFLVLMLIALMLFVSCNGSTPTKEEPAKLEERDATPEDAKLAAYIISAIDYLSGKTEAELNTIGNVKRVDNTYTFSKEGCSFEVQPSPTFSYEVKLIGSTTVEVDGNPVKFTCDFTEGTVIAGAPRTVKAELTMTTNTSSGSPTMQFDVQEAIIDGKKVNKLADVLNAAFNPQSV